MLVGERFWFWLLETDLYYLLHACPMCYNTPVMYVTLITAIGFKLHIISRDTGMLSSAWRNRLHEEFMVEGNKVRSMLLVSGNRLEGWNIFLQKDIHCLIWCFDRSGAERCEACVSVIWVPVTVVPCMHVGSLNSLMSVTSYTTDPGGISHWSSHAVMVAAAAVLRSSSPSQPTYREISCWHLVSSKSCYHAAKLRVLQSV